MALPQDLPPQAQRRAAAFVSIYRRSGELRGCIGSVEPRLGSVTEEIVLSAISAATRDPRFPPVVPSELGELEYSVDILSPLEPVDHPEDLDPARYGVVVEQGPCRGVLLPDLAGVETVTQQLAIACQKAGLDPTEGFQIYRFEVTRYQEAGRKH